MLSAPFQFFLCLSFLFFHVPPSVQMPPGRPPHYLDIIRREQLLREKMIGYNANSPVFRRDYRRAQSIYRWRGRNSLEQTVEAQGNGEYFVRFGFGTPAKQLYTVLDTGSDVTWIQCQPCTDCYLQTDPIFDPADSASYKPLPCNSQQCQRLDAPGCNSTGQTCLYGSQYGDGSTTAGDFLTETLSIDSDTFPNIAIGCGHRNRGLFAKASGVFGLGRGSLSFISQAKYSAFSYCLTDRDSVKPSILQLGSSATFKDASFTTQLLHNKKHSSFYFVRLTSVSVNNQVNDIPNMNPDTGIGGAIVDCGTTVTRLPEQVYKHVRDQFVRASTRLTYVGGTGPFDACFALAPSQTDADFPTVSFTFNFVHVLTLPRKNVMFTLDNCTCFGFAPATGYFSVIGNHQQQGIRVSFDEESGLVGFKPGSC